MGFRAPAPVAGTFHHRAAGADDGRGRRGSRGDRPAVLAWRPERLRARGGEALSHPPSRHGAHPAARPPVGPSTFAMERAAGDAGGGCGRQQRGDVTVHLKRVFDAYGPQRSYWGTDLTNSYAKASYRQRISHFTEELSFLSESDKDWVMGRAIVQRLKWT